MIKIILNGEEKELGSDITIQKLIEGMNIKSTMFVVEKNLEIVPKENYDNCKINDGDKIEVVSFFGGG